MSREYEDRRKYVRLETAFPVQFQFVDKQRVVTSPVFQGLTKDVSKGGMCIEAKTAKSRNIFKFVPGQSKLRLIINIPSSVISAELYGTVSWSREVSEFNADIHIFGVEYDEVETKSQKMIYLYVLWLHRRRIVLALFIILASIALSLFIYLTIKRLR